MKEVPDPIIWATTVAIEFKQEDQTQKDQEKLYQMFVACERIRSRDPEIKIPVIRDLFKVRGLVAYRLLYLEWIAEPNPEFRKHILEGFKKIGDHVHIASDFPNDWISVSERFLAEECEQRLAELREYFPEEMKK